ncbi:hypothetical protein Pyn_28677 [Prunus yedoensis var. nudiflora]|uniref:rRNA adenine N(6)-methyltransferase n=1 Tax=Prunus yedoensis var. nudiflora TaxID=2094558 RepID=A0A314U5Y4_PRUYE|nr:hypothetical protein Pyn_28677 [Prunus yedoensis var. nudiflora]
MIREEEEEQKMGLLSEKDSDEHGNGSSPLNTLAEAACFIAAQKTKEEILVPPKKRFSNFNFLNDMSAGPSNMSTTPKEENGLIIRGEEEVSHCPSQQATNLLEEYLIQNYPKKLRSSCKSITIFGQKLSYAQKKRASFSNMSLGLNVKKDIKKKKRRVVVAAKNKGKKVKFDNDIPPPNLPEEFKSLIGNMNGTNVQRLVHKSLFESDIKSQQCRLLLPPQQTRSTTFLEPHEKKMLRNYGSLTVPLIDPKLKQQEINLGLWNPNKAKEFYVLKFPWKRIVSENRLDVDDVVELWSFRVNHNNNEINGGYDNGGQLHFALVLVGDAIEKESDKESTTSSANDEGSSVSNNLMDQSLPPISPTENLIIKLKTPLPVHNSKPGARTPTSSSSSSLCYIRACAGKTTRRVGRGRRSNPDDYHAILTALNSKGRFPRKSLGQHYMLDSEINEQLTAAANVGEGDVVLEIGPGTGSLTNVLISAGAFVLAIEKDPHMATLVSERFAEAERFKVLKEDFAKCHIHSHMSSLLGSIEQSGANSRYAKEETILRLVESSLRTSEYWPINILVNFYSDPEFIIKVPRTNFFP